MEQVVGDIGKGSIPTLDFSVPTVDNTQEGNVGKTPISSTVVLNIGTILIIFTDSTTIVSPTSYAILVTSEPVRKSVNFLTLLAPARNKADDAISLESIRAIRISKSTGKKANSDEFPSDHGVFNVASSNTSTTMIVERFDKLEKQIIEGKLTLVEDDEKPLPKVVSTDNADSDSEVEDVVDDHAGFMALTCLKCDDDSEYGTNCLLVQWRSTKPDDDYDPYDDDLYDSDDMSENLQAICDDIDIPVNGRKKK
ncbi:hypothetical protein Tco_0121387 [Tanacetum coccineum]